MGQLIQLWDLTQDPDDPAAPYTPYSFVPLGHAGAANMSIGRDFMRRESVMSLPSMDSVLDGYGRGGGPMDRRDMPVGFRVFTNGDNDAAYDLLAAQVAPGYPQRLVYQTDSGALWFTVGSNPKITHALTSANSWGHGGYVDFTVTWRIRPDWRPRYPQIILPTFAAFNTETFSPLNNEVFPSPGVTFITLASQPFPLDATGVAGSTLPTIPDRGPVFFFVGPCGGDAGIEVIDYSSWTTDTTGQRVQRFFTLGFKLPTANDSALVDFGKQAFWHNGIPFRPFKPAYQREYFQVEPGIVNNCAINGLGANILTGGNMMTTWWKKRV